MTENETGKIFEKDISEQSKFHGKNFPRLFLFPCQHFSVLRGFGRHGWGSHFNSPSSDKKFISDFFFQLW